ncbi:MAG: hypothetical protein RDU76_11630 [Candidatus Edwardsbacteria bacterium]|nr:hypothetical protein [Candidatus Edwardsbacteria bacterium]
MSKIIIESSDNPIIEIHSEEVDIGIQGIQGLIGLTGATGADGDPGDPTLLLDQFAPFTKGMEIFNSVLTDPVLKLKSVDAGQNILEARYNDSLMMSVAPDGTLWLNGLVDANNIDIYNTNAETGTVYANKISTVFTPAVDVVNSLRGLYVEARYNGAGESHNVAAVEAISHIQGAQWIGQVHGLLAKIYYDNTNAAGGNSLYALSTFIEIISDGGTAEHVIGLKCNEINKTGTTVIPDLYGVYIARLTAGTANHGVHFEGVGNGLTWGNEGSGTVAEMFSGNSAKDIVAKSASDGYFDLYYGKMQFGDGAGGYDANLYRSAADWLKTDDNLHVYGSMFLGTGFSTAARLYVYQTTADDGLIVDCAAGGGAVADFRVAGGSKVSISSTGYQTNQLGMVINESGADSDTRIEGVGDANLFFVDASTARVGIGTDTPGYRLDINGTLNVVGAQTNSSSITASGMGANCRFDYYSSFGTARISGYYGLTVWGNNTVANGRLLSLYDGSTSTERLRVTTAGYVGINKSDPGYYLDVNGTVRLRNTVYIDTVIRGLANGSAGAPFIAWDADGNTGIFRSADNVLGFSADGTLRLAVSASGAEVIGDLQCDSLRIDQAATVGGLAPDSYFTLSLNGTSYKVPCIAA